MPSTSYAIVLALALVVCSKPTVRADPDATSAPTATSSPTAGGDEPVPPGFMHAPRPVNWQIRVKADDAETKWTDPKPGRNVPLWQGATWRCNQEPAKRLLLDRLEFVAVECRGAAGHFVRIRAECLRDETGAADTSDVLIGDAAGKAQIWIDCKVS